MTKISEELIIRFISNECTDSELAAVKEWLDESPEHARQLFEIEQAACAAASLADDEAARRRVSEMVDSRIDTYETMRRRLRRTRFMRWCAAAVVTVLLATLGVVLLRPGVDMITVDTFAEAREVTLPDNSRIWLNAYSSLTYPEHFADDSREVSLTGEAYFEVTKDATRPFRAKGDCVTVEVLGTKFNFCSTPRRENTVSLIEGKVEVSANSSRDGVVLSPGQRASFNPGNGRMSVSEGNAMLDAVWHDRLIPFNSATVAEIAAYLRELYDVDITVRPSVDNTKTYSGAATYYDSPDSTLSVLCNTLPISWKREGRNIIISAR